MWKIPIKNMFQKNLNNLRNTLDIGKQLTSPKGYCLPGNCAPGKQQADESAEDLLQCMHEHQELEEQPITDNNISEFLICTE